MAHYGASQIAKPTYEQDFEVKIALLFRELLDDPNVHRLGTRGQGQSGIDIVGHRNGDPSWPVGIQCKLKGEGKKLTEREVRTEIAEALKFKPALKEYVIVTTAKDDTKITQLAFKLAQEQAKKRRKISIYVWGWGTLEDRIRESPAASAAFDPALNPTIEAQQDALARISATQDKAATRDQVAELSKKVDERLPDNFGNLPEPFAEKELTLVYGKVLRRRGFIELDFYAELVSIVQRITVGDLRLAPAKLRAKVLARAARASIMNSFEQAKAWHGAALQLDPNMDPRLFEALAAEPKHGHERAIALLAKLNTVESRTAINHILARKAPEKLLSWVKSQDYAITDFEPVGALNIMLRRINESEFEVALGEVKSLPKSVFAELPVLYLLRASLTVASVLPADQKAILFGGLPISPRMLQIASDPKSREKLVVARKDVQALLVACAELNVARNIDFFRELDLWLGLEWHETEQETRQQIAEQIKDPQKTLSLVRLALSYGIPFDAEALNRHLRGRREIGKWSSDELFAAFQLAFHAKDYKKTAQFFDEYHDDLFSQQQLSLDALAGIEVEVLARSGRIDDAKQRFDEHKKGGRLKENADYVAERLQGIEEGDEAERLKQIYTKTKQAADLRALVHELYSKTDVAQLAVYAPLLARETRQQADFGLALRSLYNEHDYDALLALADELAELTTLDDEFASLKAWSLYQLGKVVEAQAAARELFRRRDVSSDRELVINTALESGDWGYLQSLLANEIQRVDKLAAHDLMRLAKVAKEVSSPYVDQFRNAALEKSPDDPNILLGAYILAVERGEEYQGSKAHEWFTKAAQLSGETGPIKTVSIKEMAGLGHGWEKQVDSVSTMLREARAPLFLIAAGFRRQPIDYIVGAALRNSRNTESKRKTPILAFSGSRGLMNIGQPKSLALDPTAIFTLQFAGLLRRTIEAFDRIVVSPSTLSSLFMSRQFIRVSQPSEKAKAERLLKLVTSGAINVLPEGRAQERRLAAEVGDELASLLERARDFKGTLVRSAPVHKVGSLLEADADVSGFSDALGSTRSVLTFLSGKVEATVESQASAYINQVDKGWPWPCEISEKSELYLDQLAVTYLDYVGLLEPLTHNVSKVFISKDAKDHASAVIESASMSEELIGFIEQIQLTLHAALESGKLTFTRRQTREIENDERDYPPFPTMDILADLSAVDVVVADDRFLNRELFWADASKQCPVATSLDVLENMVSRQKLTKEEYWATRHKLRAAGYCYIPLDATELKHLLSRAKTTEDGSVLVETPELRAVRENVSLPLRADVAAFGEDAWLANARLILFQSTRDCWSSGVPDEHVESRADWLLATMPDPLSWCRDPDNAGLWQNAVIQRTNHCGLMLFAFAGQEALRKRFISWLESRITEPVRENLPEVWKGVLHFTRNYFDRLFENVQAGDGMSQKALTKRLAVALLMCMPESIRNHLTADETFIKVYGFTPTKIFPLDSVNQVELRSFRNAVRRAVAGAKQAQLTMRDDTKKVVSLGYKRGVASLRIEEHTYNIPDADLLSKAKGPRVGAMRRMLSAHPLLRQEHDKWFAIANKRALGDSEYDELLQDLVATPEGVIDRFKTPQKINPETLMPDSAEYYQRLMMLTEPDGAVEDLIEGALKQNRRDLLKRAGTIGARRIGVSGVWMPLVPMDLFGTRSRGQVESLLEANDPFTLLAGFEICAANRKDRKLVALGTKFLAKLFANQDAERRRDIFSACAVISMVKLRGVFPEGKQPLFWFRATALAHAGVLTNAVFGVDNAKSFFKWAAETFGPEFIWHTNVDYREAPRWKADWISPEHIHAELVSRAIGAVGKDKPPSAWDKILAPAVERIKENAAPYSAVLAGPLDDWGQASFSFGEDKHREIERILKKVKHFHQVPGIVHLIDAEPIAAVFVKGVSEFLDNQVKEAFEQNPLQTPFILSAAHIAACNRDPGLANKVIGLAIRQASRAKSAKDAADMLSVVVCACAAWQKPTEHRKQLAQACTGIVYAITKKEHLDVALLIFTRLVRRDPVLASTLGRATAVAAAALREP